MFDPSVYRARREALRARLAACDAPDGIAIFIGNRESPFNYADNCYPFRQDSSFLYFFGIRLPGLAASIDLASGKTVLYRDEPSIDDIVWTGPQERSETLAAMAGVDAIKPRASFAHDSWSADTVHFLPPYRADTRLELAMIADHAPDTIDSGASHPLIRAIVELREIKDPGEVSEIEKAVATSVEMHRAVLAGARAGMTEADVAALAAYVANRAGGMVSFPPIATTKGGTLHNLSRTGILADGGLFLLDCGAETASGYAGDLTTTFPVNGRFDPRQKEIYELVLAAHKAAREGIKPGTPYSTVHFAAARAFVEGLSGLGLMRGNTDDAVSSGAHALFFPHGIGHQMGLDVHDMESLGELNVGYDGEKRSELFGLKSLRMAKPLKAGMVVTVEPGVYFIPELVARWKAERRFADFIAYDRLEPFMALGGVRNEEDWLVTETGGRRLGPDFDKSVGAIEAGRKG